MVQQVKGYMLCDICKCPIQYVAKSGDEYTVQCARCGRRDTYGKYGIAKKIATKLALGGYAIYPLDVFIRAERLFKLCEKSYADDYLADASLAGEFEPNETSSDNTGNA